MQLLTRLISDDRYQQADQKVETLLENVLATEASAMRLLYSQNNAPGKFGSALLHTRDTPTRCMSITYVVT